MSLSMLAGNWREFLPTLASHPERIAVLETKFDKLVASQRKTYFHGRDDAHNFWVYPKSIKLNSKWDTHLNAVNYCSNSESEGPVMSSSLIQYKCLGHSTLDDFRPAEEEWRRERVIYPIDGIQTVYSDIRVDKLEKKVQPLETLIMRYGVELRNLREEFALSVSERVSERHAIIIDLKSDLEKLSSAYKSDMRTLEIRLEEARADTHSDVAQADKRLQKLMTFLKDQVADRKVREEAPVIPDSEEAEDAEDAEEEVDQDTEEVEDENEETYKPCEKEAITFLRIIILIMLTIVALKCGYPLGITCTNVVETGIDLNLI